MSAPPAFLRHAERNLPRYTSYPTAVSFGPMAMEGAHAAFAALRPDEPLSIYVHIPFCDRLCWYCGCHTTIVHDYERVAAYVQTLRQEIDVWARRLPPHGGAAHLHFGGGSPNALKPEDFLSLVAQARDAFSLAPNAEIAVELDPGELTSQFLDAVGAAGVTRASLGVQTFDADVQAKVNRLQPLEKVAAAFHGLRDRGVKGVNFDLMYGLPSQSPESVAESASQAAELGPDRLAVFGYAHVPWIKKHQMMIAEAELADAAGRWAQADAADEALVSSGYRRIGIDHYAKPDDSLAAAARLGRLKRNFQGYTDDAGEALVPLGASSIGRIGAYYLQNTARTDEWSKTIAAGDLAIARGLKLTQEDAARAAIIERLMCDLTVELEDPASYAVEMAALQDLAKDGLCEIEGARIRVKPRARRLARAVAACFDQKLPLTEKRHSKAA